MNKAELKKILKPLIKECIKEVIFEDGALSTVVSEVVKGLGNPLSESRLPPPVVPKEMVLESKEQAQVRRNRLQENRNKMMKAIGSDSYNGVNLFEGTTPTPGPSATQYGALKDVVPNDPGVDISSFMGSSRIWKKLAGK
jgi:hypothetical protein